ncbi:MAG TPA: hypothetical protein VFY12_10330, partial [Arenimonas sp.]|nr:hypothetical protein [Arenimonas sp.]
AAQTSFAGDIRSEYSALDRRDRDGSESSNEELRGRVRLGFSSTLERGWSARVRVAARWSTGSNHGLDWHTQMPQSGGLVAGQASFDELQLGWNGERFGLRVGRLQTRADLPDVMGKTLTRKDSPSTEVTWTDGVELNFRHGDWLQQLILQRNADGGASNVLRAPLDFSRDGSRVGYSWIMSSKAALGPLDFRGLQLVYLPDALASDGLASTRREDYLALSLRASATWPLAGGSRFQLAGELGHALTTPTRSSLRLGTSGDSGGLALQASANWLEFASQQALALVYGRADAGWLISPDFQPNMDLVELRWQWTPAKHSAVEARWRRREDLDLRSDRGLTRIDRDVYVRYTYKF